LKFCASIILNGGLTVKYSEITQGGKNGNEVMKFVLREDTISRFRVGFAEIEKVIIYGSREKGIYREGSDIDMVLEGDMLTEEIRKEKSGWLLTNSIHPT